MRGWYWIDFKEIGRENEDKIQVTQDNRRKKSEIQNLYYAHMISKCRHYINVSCALCKWLNVKIGAADKV
jgi:hypothetical protein